MRDPELWIERVGEGGRPYWRVELCHGEEPPSFASVAPLTDVDLANLPALQSLTAFPRTWEGTRQALAASALPPEALRTMGMLISHRLLGTPAIAHRFQRIRDELNRRNPNVQFCLNVLSGDDPVLRDLPVEVCHDGAGFVFKQLTVPLVRCAPYEQAMDQAVSAGSRVLLGIAPAPETADLTAALQRATGEVEKGRRVPELVNGITAEELHRRLFIGEPVRILHLICRAQATPGNPEKLHLADRALPIPELGEWLYQARELGRPVSIVMLCATHDGTGGATGTSGAAAWLARSQRASLAFGFRAPMFRERAIAWSERVFQRFSMGGYFENLLADLRRNEVESSSEWATFTMHGRPPGTGEYMQVMWPLRKTLVRTEMRPDRANRQGLYFGGGPPGGGAPSGLVPTEVVYKVLDMPELNAELTQQEAAIFLSRTAWGTDTPPPEEQPYFGHLLWHLGTMPLALHLAGCALRRGLGVTACLEALKAAGDASNPLACALTVTYRDLDTPARKALLAMSLLPRGIGRDEQIASILDWPAPAAASAVDTLVRCGLAERTLSFSCQLHAPVANAMRAWLLGFPEMWNAFHKGVARSAVELAKWVAAPIGLGAERGPKRWIFADDFFRFLDSSPWQKGAPGKELIEEACRLSAQAKPG